MGTAIVGFIIKKIHKNKKKKQDDELLWFIEGYWKRLGGEFVGNEYRLKGNHLFLPLLKMQPDADYWEVLREAQYIFANDAKNNGSEFIIYKIFKGCINDVIK